MSKTLDGQIAVVTGAARGLGRAFADALSSQGAHIVACDRDPAVHEVEGLSYVADVADPDGVRTVVDGAVAAHGRIGRAHHEGETPRRLVSDRAADLLARADVDSVGGLVEHEHLRVDAEPLAENDLLLVAAAQGHVGALRIRRIELEFLDPMVHEDPLVPNPHATPSAERFQVSEGHVLPHVEIADRALRALIAGNEPHASSAMAEGLGRGVVAPSTSIVAPGCRDAPTSA